MEELSDFLRSPGSLTASSLSYSWAIGDEFAVVITFIIIQENALA
jgi:hypothetical protein